MKSQMPRPEYPRPQFKRQDWLNLNGVWSYVFDFGESGMDQGRELYRSRGFENRIMVPFCPESKLSGVEYTDFIPAMWYHRCIEAPVCWQGKRILLHIGGADYECEAFVDGVSAGTHYGGTVSFSLDITRLLAPGQSHDLVIRIKDHVRNSHQPRGKQSIRYASSGCSYTRTTGIWQTVWLEALAPNGLKEVHIIPDLDGGAFSFIPCYYGEPRGNQLIVAVHANAECEGRLTVPANSGIPVFLPLNTVRPWCPEDPFLYDLVFTVQDAEGNTIDTVTSYAGLRKIHIEGNQVYLNNEPLYQRLVLDQGFYPDGVWTAPSDEALRRDIALAMHAGFNGARLHQKVFEERFHYWADKLGYLTWGESASWGCDCNSELSARNFISEWQEIIIRDRNHPSIIAWTPFNETGDDTNPSQHMRLHTDCYKLCKVLDPTRPVNDASGWIHHITDFWTVHTYKQDADALREQLTPDAEGNLFRNVPASEPDYEGQPYLVDEFGGIKWGSPADSASAVKSWGYGDAPKTLDEFYQRLVSLVDVVRSLKHVSGYCYTQLTDVEQEMNGIYRYDRTEKFDMSRISVVFGDEPERPGSLGAC